MTILQCTSPGCPSELFLGGEDSTDGNLDGAMEEGWCCPKCTAKRALEKQDRRQRKNAAQRKWRAKVAKKKMQAIEANGKGSLPSSEAGQVFQTSPTVERGVSPVLGTASSSSFVRDSSFTLDEPATPVQEIGQTQVLDFSGHAPHPYTPEPTLPGPALFDVEAFDAFEDQLMEADSFQMVPEEDEVPEEPLQELKVRETSRIAQNIIDSPEATMGPNPTPFSFLEVEKRLKGHEMIKPLFSEIAEGPEWMRIKQNYWTLCDIAKMLCTWHSDYGSCQLEFRHSRLRIAPISIAGIRNQTWSTLLPAIYDYQTNMQAHLQLIEAAIHVGSPVPEHLFGSLQEAFIEYQYIVQLTRASNMGAVYDSEIRLQWQRPPAALNFTDDDVKMIKTMVNLSPSQQTQIQDLCHKHSFEQNSLLEKLQGLQAKLTTAVKVLDEVLQGTNFRFNPATARARAVHESYNWIEALTLFSKVQTSCAAKMMFEVLTPYQLAVLTAKLQMHRFQEYRWEDEFGIWLRSVVQALTVIVYTM